MARVLQYDHAFLEAGDPTRPAYEVCTRREPEVIIFILACLRRSPLAGPHGPPAFVKRS
jgi:hypothetical protein